MEKMDLNSPKKTVTPFSLLGGDMGENPFPYFSQMRETGAVIRVPNPMGGQAWLVTRMEEAVQVLKDHVRYTVDASTLNGNSKPVDPSEPSTFVNGKSMNFVDEPDHKRLRGLVSKAFTPRYMDSLRPRIQELADELLDQVQARGQMDLVKDYAYPLPINVISEMLGVPPVDREQIHAWSDSLARGLGAEKREPAVTENLRAFGEYTIQLVADKRRRPGDDLISQLIAIEEEGDRLNEEELISMITLLIFAGHETTSNLIATGTLMLLDHPAQLEKLKDDRSLIPSAVEELLRFNGPVAAPAPRFATDDVELGGQRIQRGDMIIVMLKSANRDERQFSHPDELDITRKISRQLAFGYGIHMCLGAPLARVEGDIAFTTLLKRMPNLRLGIPRENVDWHLALFSQRLTSLPVVF